MVSEDATKYSLQIVPEVVPVAVANLTPQNAQLTMALATVKGAANLAAPGMMAQS